MKFPSISQLWLSYKSVVKRFSIPLIYAVIATICAISVIDISRYNQFQTYYTKGIYLGNFGLVLSLAWCLFCERSMLNKLKVAFGQLNVLVILTLIYFLLDPFLYDAHIITLIVLGFSFHVLVSFSAFSSKEENVGFWQINKTFFLRFATSALYSGVLFVGIAIAILSVNTLFNMKFDGRIYPQLWVFIVGIFNTVFFLAGIPNPISSLNLEQQYPKGLKVFTQYVLLPLVTIYLGILLAYEAKIIVEWSLPQNSVAILILGYAVFGILSILLIHPIRNLAENKWINLFAKSFYLLMIPLLALLSVSIYKRVTDYGITESRYLLIALAVWLTFITVYFLIKGLEQVRMIPMSLFVFALLIAIGPWGIKHVSKVSQENRLAKILKQKPDKKRNLEANNIINYLIDYHGVESMQAFLKPDLTQLTEKITNQLKNAHKLDWEIKDELQDTVTGLMVSGYKNYNLDKDEAYVYERFKSESKGVIDVDNAIKFVVLEEYNNDDKTIMTEAGKTYILKMADKPNIQIIEGKQKITFIPDSLLEILSENDKPRITDNNGAVIIKSKYLTMSKTLNNFRFECRFDYLNGGSKEIYYKGYVLVYPIVK
jgi:hypothetical protein